MASALDLEFFFQTIQVISLMEWPALSDLAPNVFPPDVVDRAKELQEEIGSVGAYSHSQGVPFIRENVAKFIQRTSICALFFHVFPTSYCRARRLSLQPRSHLSHRWRVRRRFATDIYAHHFS